MSDFGGDFGGDAGLDAPTDGGPFDLNDNGSSLDEFVLFAAITDSERGGRGGGQPRGGCCALPALALPALLALLLLLLV